ncbi:MAG: amidase [Chloroflexi bacterium]|nr:amidase [Chloroflexota bacterium]
MDLTALTITEAAAQIAARKLSPVELTQAHLDRIAQINPAINAYITVTADTALAEARAAEQAIARGEQRGELHGIPLALKDLYETAGVRTTAGSSFFRDHVPAADGVAVQKLRAAGAVMLGKLNMHEIALGVTNDNPHFGACKNPWALERIPGGSSGGSGAALAARLCPGSLGSDTGGSIRIPASLCGIVGLKPTYGRVSVRGVIPLSWNLDHAGPMTRAVRDAALLLQAIAGHDADDPYSADVPVDDYVSHIGEGVKGWRIGLARGYFAECDSQVARAVERAAEVLAHLGAHVTEVQIEELRAASAQNGVVTTSDAAAFHRERLKDKPDGFGADVLTRLRSGAGLTSTDYSLARRTQTLVKHRMAQVFHDYDLLLTPTTPIPAPLREGQDAVEQARMLTRYTSPFNTAGLPVLSVPCGFTAEGLPIGLQIVGANWTEARVLCAGHAYEQATEWHTKTAAV